MSAEQPATIRTRRLAGELRRLREVTGLTGDQAAKQLGWDPSKLSRYETARRRVQSKDLQALLDLYAVPDGKRQALVDLARNSRFKGWWDAYGDTLPTELAAYIALEAEATSIRGFSAQIVPGMLQTDEYARSVIRAGLMDLVPRGEIERRVEARKTRQRLLGRESSPLDYWIILSEAALRNRVGSPEDMRTQCHHLMKLSRTANVTIQVLPFVSGAHPATAGTFSILSFPAHYDDDVVYVETLTSNLWVEDERDVHRYTLAFDHLRVTAYEVEESLSFIAAVADEL
ncbi:helix-turn-helix domain-containing protein [Streptosporangium sp. NBC_01469]|uniref:helix-turn-helix domain-containing protein n=1 Tax=Streptosporangium sp. NBC_01469 TaxID=2903898 RepID=UPI002E2940B3|nr:helix-turn-helix transcriptional regulator [Streptosporangium sp. NBC_01469]